MQKSITFIYPALFGELNSPWDEEYNIAKKIGLNVSKIDEKTYAIKEDLSSQIVVYRGWMLSLENYKKLIKSVEKKNGVMLIGEHQFLKINSFSSWYSVLSKYTMKSHFVEDFDLLGSYFKKGESYFVKDNLKSLGSEKSIACSKEDAISIYNKIQKNRDFKIPNNGIFLRKIVPIENEERFFVVDGVIISSCENEERIRFVQKISDTLLKKLNVVFASIDVATSNGKNILVEVGGLQVSDMDKNGDLKEIEWYYKQFSVALESLVGKNTRVER